MSDQSILQDRIHSRRAVVIDEDPDASEDCGSFGFLRGVKERALMLDFRLKNGNREAFPYALLERVSYDPSEGLTLFYLGVSVRLRGRNLMRPVTAGVSLLDAIHRHRVPWIGEVDELRSLLKSEEAIVVTKIEITAITRPSG